MTLVLHIGLPKTASSFLQTFLFSQQTSFSYVHNQKRSLLERALYRQLRASSWTLPALERAISLLLPRGPLLLSDENLSLNAVEPWENRGPTPEQFAERISRVARSVGTVKLIWGVRRQDQWLASRYAESAKVFGTFCQDDFERRVTTLCSKGAIGSLNWLNFATAHEALSLAVGPDHLLTLPSELLRTDLPMMVQRMERFLGVTGWWKLLEAGKQKRHRKNKLSTAPDRWRLRRRDAELALTPDTKSRILDVYRGENQRLAERLKLDLGQHGYY